MSELTEKKIVEPSIYAQLAKRFEVTEVYVGLINNGHRKAKRGKGLKVRQALEQLKKQSNG